MPKKRWLEQPGPDIPARLETLLARVRRVRKSLYPASWTADPLYYVEQELESLLQDMKNA